MLADVCTFQQAFATGKHLALLIGQTYPRIIGKMPPDVAEYLTYDDRIIYIAHHRQIGNGAHMIDRLLHAEIERITHLPRQLLQTLIGLFPCVIGGKVIDQHKQREHGHSHCCAHAGRYQSGEPQAFFFSIFHACLFLRAVELHTSLEASVADSDGNFLAKLPYEN